MTPFLLICFAAGVVLAIPVWIVRQHSGSRRGLRLARGFDRRDAIPCTMAPVALNARLLAPSDLDAEVAS
jgi:hypothetical protein